MARFARWVAAVTRDRAMISVAGAAWSCSLPDDLELGLVALLSLSGNPASMTAVVALTAGT
jgi:hypothetical protein